jgi:hypothetical protein
MKAEAQIEFPIALNQDAMKHLRTEVRLEIVPGATHPLEEPGALDEVTRLARGWFTRHFRGRTTPSTMLDGVGPDETWHAAARGSSTVS